jgi:hypothetical protein
MFLNVKAYNSSGALIYEVNPYDTAVGTLKGMPEAAQLGTNEIYEDRLVYEMKPSSTYTNEGNNNPTFHFVLADGRYKDNRIPPKGFDIKAAPDRLSVPVYGGEEDASYFSGDEYAGGYHAISLTIPNASRIEVNLYYQVTSREYILFLENQINGSGGTLPSSSYIIQSDPFFARLKAWGTTIRQLWENTKNWPGAAPYLMTSASWQGQPQCTAPLAPTSLTATPGNKQVALSWGSVSGAATYSVYYDQSGKSQLVAKDLGVTSYTDVNLTNGQTYCYKVTATNSCGESAFSSPPVCATVSNQGSTSAGVTQVETGKYVKSGKITNFEPTSAFVQGDAIVFQLEVKDSDGSPVSSARVDLLISGPSTVQLTSSTTNAQGVTEVTWTTSAPNKKGAGGTPTGAYKVEVVGVTATGYVWNGTRTSAVFTIQ